MKKQREMELELMKMARAQVWLIQYIQMIMMVYGDMNVQAIEEENMMQEAMKRSGRREVSPGLEAARGAQRRIQVRGSSGRSRSNSNSFNSLEFQQVRSTNSWR